MIKERCANIREKGSTIPDSQVFPLVTNGTVCSFLERPPLGSLVRICSHWDRSFGDGVLISVSWLPVKESLVLTLPKLLIGNPANKLRMGRESRRL